MATTIIVTENWSERRYQRAEYAQRGWIVTGIADEVAAIKAVGDRYDGAVYKGAAFIADNRLFGEEPRVDLVGPTTYHVVTTYTKNTGSVDPEPDNPLDKEIDWDWDEGHESINTDIDPNGDVITTTAGLPFSQSPTAENDLSYLTASRNESQYDVKKNLAYRGRVNQDSVLIPMAGSVEPGQMRILSYRPLQSYSKSTKYVEVAYRFEVRRGNRKDDDGLWDGFKHRILSQSYMGWWDDGGTKTPGQFVTSKGGAIPEPTLLDASGKPLDSTIRVDKNGGGFAAPVAAPDNRLVDASLLEVVRDDSRNIIAVFVKNPKHGKIAFSGLNLF